MDPFKCRSNWIEFLLIAASFILCFQVIDAASPKINTNVCQSEACKTIATSLLLNMNQKVNPCDNFYEFVCGNFSRNAVIPSTESVNNLFTRVSDVVNNQLKNDIENNITEEDPETLQKLLTYYKTCMNEDQIEKTSIMEFLIILKQLGDWPVLLGKSYPDSNFNWTNAVNNISRMGYSRNYFFTVDISSDLKNNTKNLIYLDQPVFGTSQAYLLQGLENDIVKAYFKYMVDLAELFGADREQANLDLGESLNFEIELAKISLSNTEHRDKGKWYNPMEIAELQSNYPSIPWLQYLNDLFSPYLRLTENDVVIVKAPTFFEKLGDLLARTPKRVLANYLMWRVALSSATQLNQKVVDMNNEFDAFLTGQRSKDPRWQTCLNSASYYLYLATSSLYVRRNFDKASKDEAIDMINHLRQSFKNIVSEVDWMDETTRSAALQKIEQMLLFIGYFDELLDDKKIDNFHKDLNVYPESYLKTVLSCKRFYDVIDLKNYGYPNSRIDWTDYSSDMVNAFYNPYVNAIQIPAAILQGDFFNKSFPKCVNYAAIGSIMGHEMTHALDDQGRKFNSFGNMVDWWNAKTAEEYLKRAKCIVDQYSSYIDPQVGLHLNGNLTQGENIADNGGMKEAYLAYTAFEKENGVESTLPGFEHFTSRQIFWISYSNLRCSKYETQALRNLIITDTHSPDPFRIIGTVTNSPDFAKDFNCPVGSPMNPEKKCSVW